MSWILRPTVRNVFALIPMLLASGCHGESSLADPNSTLVEGEDPAPVVLSTEPAVAEQGRRLTVRILGSGFNPTARSTWERDGVSDPKVTVHSTTYVNSGEVRADVVIASDAEATLYDVGVTITGRRKKGAGIEKGTAYDVFRIAVPVTSWSGAIATNGFQPAPFLSRGDSSFILPALWTRLDFTATVAAGTAPCLFRPDLTEKEKSALLRKLVDMPRKRFLYVWMGSERDDLGRMDDDPILRSGSGIHSQWEDSLNLLVNASIGWNNWWESGGGSLKPPRFIAGEPAVRVLGPSVYQFVGGPVFMTIDRLPDVSLENRVTMVCPNRDTVAIAFKESR